jgi:hypothetical protein
MGADQLQDSAHSPQVMEMVTGVTEADELDKGAWRLGRVRRAAPSVLLCLRPCQPARVSHIVKLWLIVWLESPKLISLWLPNASAAQC